MSSAQDSKRQVDFTAIVQLIQQGDPYGEELLYATFMKGLRYLAIRKVGYDDADECVHDSFIALSQKVRQGALREPAALLKYARTILDRVIMERYEERRKWNSDVDFDTVAATKQDSRPTPEKVCETDSRLKVMQRGLAQLRPREREILVRFYLKEQDQKTICQEMHLSSTQFRLMKSRSKQKLEEYTSCYLKSTASMRVPRPVTALAS